MNFITQFKYFLWYFGWFKVPLIGYLRPRLITLTEQTLVIKLRLNRRSKNHLNSMYFGALAVGADLAGGMHAFYHAKHKKLNVSLAFKSFHAQFLKRPESDVYFVCTMGETVKRMLITSASTKLRINELISITAYTNYPDKAETVATFTLELSLKVI